MGVGLFWVRHEVSGYRKGTLVSCLGSGLVSGGSLGSSGLGSLDRFPGGFRGALWDHGISGSAPMKFREPENLDL